MDKTLSTFFQPLIWPVGLGVVLVVAQMVTHLDLESGL